MGNVAGILYIRGSLFAIFLCFIFSNRLYAIEPILHTTSTQQDNPYHDLGFVPRQNFSNSTSSSSSVFSQPNLLPACRGAYFHQYLDNTKDPAKLYGYAQQIIHHTRQQKIELVDKVEVYYQNKRYLADYGEFDQQKSTLRLYGHLRIYDEQNSLTGKQAVLYTANNQIQVNQAEYLLLTQGARIQFQEMEKKSDGRIYLTQGHLTFCEPGDNSWSLSGKKIRLYPEKGFGEANHLIFSIADVPVFYLPYLYFPIDDERHSGLLPPQISHSTLSGSKYVQPVYLNLAPNYDATLVPTTSSRRGLGLESEFRWLSQYTENSLVYGTMRDKSLNTQDGKPLSRWMTRLKHQGSYQLAKVNLSSHLDYNEFSDVNYLDEIGTLFKVNKQSIMPKQANLGMKFDITKEVKEDTKSNFSYNRFDAKLSWIDYTILDAKVNAASKPYASLPRLEVRNNLADITQIANGKVQVDNLLRYDHFVRDIATQLSTTEINAGKNSAGNRNILIPKAKIDWSTNWGYLIPEWQIHYTDYTLKQQGLLDAKQNRLLQIGSLSGGLFFEAYRKNRVIQTLEPQLFYVHVPLKAEQNNLPNFDSAATTFNFQQLFSTYRFSGFDRIGDQEKLSLGITTRFLSAQGLENLRFSLGQGFFLKANQLSIDTNSTTEKAQNERMRTPLATELNYNLNNYWKLNHQLIYNDLAGQTERQNLTLNYDKPQAHYFNLDYSEAKNIRQFTVKTKNHLDNHWSLLGMLRYDLLIQNSQRDAVGLEYQSCCWKLGLVVFNEYTLANKNQRNQGFYLQFALKGLGNSGKGSMQVNSDIDALLQK